MPGRMEWEGNILSRPPWMADFSERDQRLLFPAKLDYTKFVNTFGIVCTLSAQANAGATSIAINAATWSLPQAVYVAAVGGVVVRAPEILFFGVGLYAKTTADIKIGDTSIAVEPLPVIIPNASQAIIPKGGKIYLPSGIPVARTLADRTALNPFGPYTVGIEESGEWGLSCYDIDDAVLSPYVTILKPGAQTSIYENYLPNYAAMIADVGLQNPTAGAILTTAGVDATFGAGRVYGAYAYKNANGQTKLSPVTSIVVLATGHVTFPAVSFPAGATGVNYYISTGINNPALEYAGTNADGSTINFLAAPTTGGAPSTSNTTFGPLASVLALIRKNFSCILGVN